MGVLSEVAAVTRRDPILIDTRPKDAFAASHLPTAVNFPFNSVVEETTGLMKSTDKLAEDFAKLGIQFSADGKTAAATIAATTTAATGATTAIIVDSAGHQPPPMMIYCQTGT